MDFKNDIDYEVAIAYFFLKELLAEADNTPQSEWDAVEGYFGPKIPVKINFVLLANKISSKLTETQNPGLEIIAEYIKQFLFNLIQNEVAESVNINFDNLKTVFIDLYYDRLLKIFKELESEYQKRFNPEFYNKEENPFCPFEENEISLKGTVLMRKEYPQLDIGRGDSKKLRILKIAVEKKGNWFEVQKTAVALGIENNSFRPLVAELNKQLKKLDLKLVSTLESQMEGKPIGGKGAYHLTKISKI